MKKDQPSGWELLFLIPVFAFVVMPIFWVIGMYSVRFMFWLTNVLP